MRAVLRALSDAESCSPCCLDISGNTSDGSGNPASTNPRGIGLRKNGTSTSTTLLVLRGWL